jgi:hypothetical protein
MSTTWPPLPLDAWRATRDTLHRFAQIIGKIQLARTPLVNHFWNAALHVTSRGLSTSALRADGGTFDIELDLVRQCLMIRASDGRSEQIDLRPMTVADFYRDVRSALGMLGIDVHIWDHPVEIASEAIPFTQDRVHRAYDRDYVERFADVLFGAAEVLEEFRGRFTGKCSGVGFYWGTFDLAVARYSGRRAPTDGMSSGIEREAYSHEVSEVGFWPGDDKYPAPAFFALQYPAPPGYEVAAVRPAAAGWFGPSRCFVLPYDAVRSGDAASQILDFCQSTYEAGATLAGWNRAELERAPEAVAMTG